MREQMGKRDAWDSNHKWNGSAGTVWGRQLTRLIHDYNSAAGINNHRQNVYCENGSSVVPPDCDTGTEITVLGFTFTIFGKRRSGDEHPLNVFGRGGFK